MKLFEEELSGTQGDNTALRLSARSFADIGRTYTCAEFVESEGATTEEFFKECRDVYEGNYQALFEESEHAWFVEHLVACMDYKHFYGLMVNEARRLHRK